MEDEKGGQLYTKNRKRFTPPDDQVLRARSSGDRAAAFEAAGRGFESLRARQGFHGFAMGISSCGPPVCKSLQIRAARLRPASSCIPGRTWL